MKKLTALLVCLLGASTSYAATIINADASLITGTGFANHYGKYGQFNPVDGKRLDLTTPTLATGATSGSTTYGTISVYATASRSVAAGSNFGCSSSANGGAGWRIRINGSAAAGIHFEKMDAFLINDGDDSATMDADNDTMAFTGRLQSSGTSTMVAQGSDSQWRFALQAGGSWYLTDAVNVTDIGYEMSGAKNISHTIEATEVLWYAYDPTTKPVNNGEVDVGSTPVTPDFTQVTAAGVHQQLVSNGTAGNHGFTTFTVTGEINGSNEAWAPTNSVSWSNIDNTTNTGSFYQNAGFNFGTTPANGTNYTSPDVVAGITAGTPIYGASYGTARYVTNSVGFGAAFDWGVFPNNNGGARLRLNKPDGGFTSSTNVHSGVTVGYNLFMFPMEGFTENDADISLQTWSNQGSGGPNMTDGEIRFVVAKNLNGTTNWAISSPITHTVGSNQYATVNTATTYQELSWYNYSPANAWGVGSVGSQVATPYPGDAILAGFRLSAAGIDTNNATASVFGARSFSFSGREWNEYDNDNLVVSMDTANDWTGNGGNGVQWETGSFAFDEDNPIIQSNARIGDGLGGGQETNWWAGAPVYAGFVADGAYPAPVQGYDYASNIDSNFNSAALSAANSSSGDGLKIQWNGPRQSGVGSIPDLDYENGRYQAGDIATALLVWKSDDFLGGSDGSTYEMTAANDVIKATVSFADRDGILGSGEFRFVIKENDQYYISYAVTNFTDEASDVELVRQGTTTAWFPYDPAADITSVDTSANATQASLDLTDVQAFGVWMEATVATNTGYRLYPRIGLDRFQAGAIVITPTASSIKQAWLDTYGSGMSGSTADSDDPDGDGIPNILEYAFGGDPTDAASNGNQPIHSMATGANDADMLEIVYFEHSDAANRGLSTDILETDNLVFTDFAAPSQSYEVGRGASSHSGFDAVTNHVPMSDAVKFIRIDVNYSE